MTGPKGYLYAELDISDPQMFYDEYMPAVRPVLEKFGAKFLIASNDIDVVEGGRTVKRVILLEFASPERAREFFGSDAYQAIISLRLNSAGAHLYLIDGLPPA